MKDVNIVFCTDKNYAKYLPPLIESILRNTTYKCNFYVVYSTINDEDKKKIIKTVTDFKDSTVDFVKFENIELLENNEISKYASSFRGGYDAFSRLFLTELLLSKNIKNCIYFDIDVVVKKNADELFSLVKNIKFIAGVVDSVTIKNGGKWVYDKYINSGVLLMNLENLKSINFAEKCLDFIFSVIANAGWDKESNGYSTFVMRSLKDVWIAHPNDREEIHKYLSKKLRNIDPHTFGAESKVRYSKREFKTGCVLYMEDLVCNGCGIEKKIYPSNEKLCKIIK